MLTMTKTDTKTKTKCIKDPTCARFLKSRGCRDFKCGILTGQPVNFSSVNQTRLDHTRSCSWGNDDDDDDDDYDYNGMMLLMMETVIVMIM